MRKLDSQVMDLAERKMIDALEICDVDHVKPFIKYVLHSALNSLL